MMSYVVTAPLVVVPGPDGKMHHCYYGSLVTIADAARAGYLLAEGLIATSSGKPTDDAKASAVVISDVTPIDEPNDGRPPHVATKAKWVDYAVSRGIAREDAETMTKERLIAVTK